MMKYKLLRLLLTPSCLVSMVYFVLGTCIAGVIGILIGSR